MSPSDETQENMVTRWAWRRLNDRFEKFLSLDVSWLGPWKCLLLGEPSDCRSLNSILQKLLKDMKCKYGYYANKTLLRVLPWENLPVLRKHEIYRIPSVGSVSAIINISCNRPLDGFYLLNPGGYLERTQVEFEDWSRDQKLEGKDGTVPPAEDHDLFIYIGRGSGAQYIPSYKIRKLDKCAATLLMGCSSGCLSLKGRYNPQGAVISYLLVGSPAIVANLWEVTDKDIDRFGKALLNAWLKERSKYSIVTPLCDLVIQHLASMNISSTILSTR
ncbi:hypothetical protein MKX01_038704 [Papaver californicum]|nr:hypothetical protein MKX01_038704 [Papaver californicum]